MLLEYFGRCLLCVLDLNGVKVKIKRKMVRRLLVKFLKLRESKFGRM